MLQDFANLMTGLAGDSLRVARAEIDGLTVSTVVTRDMGPETAILDAAGAHPVERYDTVEAARSGHEKWCEAMRGGVREIKKLGYGSLTEARMITLQPEH